MGNEENSNKISKENEELKLKLFTLNKETQKNSLANSLSSTNASLSNQDHNGNTSKKTKTIDTDKYNINISNKFKDHYDDLNPEFKISQINSHRVSVEYLKNVLLKYLEAIAIGNEFQIKILENVIFSILKIPNSERQKLEDKRNRSSFYLNLWYNAKAYLSEKIYGNPNDLESIDNANINNEGLKFEMDKNFSQVIQGNFNIEYNENINPNENNYSNENEINKISNEIRDKKSSPVINDYSNKEPNKVNNAIYIDKDLNGDDIDVNI